MKVLLTKYQRTIDQLPLTARSIILTMVLGFIFIIWYYGLWLGLHHSLQTTSKKIVELNQSIPQLEYQIKTEEIEFKTAQARLLKEKTKIDLATTAVLSPQEIKKFLNTLLTTNNDLTFLELKNLPPHITAVPNSNLKLFAHNIIIRFLGDYFATMRYLQSLEKSVWKLSWERLEYKVIQYPTAEITLQFHTVSESQEWLSV